MSTYESATSLLFNRWPKFYWWKIDLLPEPRPPGSVPYCEGVKTWTHSGFLDFLAKYAFLRTMSAQKNILDKIFYKSCYLVLGLHQYESVKARYSTFFFYERVELKYYLQSKLFGVNRNRKGVFRNSRRVEKCHCAVLHLSIARKFFHAESGNFWATPRLILCAHNFEAL